MQIGFVGLGKMGLNMVDRLVRAGHQIIALDTDAQRREDAKKVGAMTAEDIADLLAQLPTRKVVWVMVPSGAPTDSVIHNLAAHLKAGDILIDGGNSHFRHSMQHAQQLTPVEFLDVGTSGGIWGLTKGYCLMIGGKAQAFEYVEPIFKDLAPQDGYQHVGPSGSGHYVKMIHNAIEYGLMQAYGEGFALLEAAPFKLNLPDIATLWGQGSVVRSWLLELLTSALQNDPHLAQIAGKVADSGEGRWSMKEAIDAAIPVPVLTLALQMRFLSRLDQAFSAKVCAALRQQFGGHSVQKIET